MSGHTPTPWKFVPWHIAEGPSQVLAPAGWLICETSSDDDAAFIVEACNNYEQLKTLITGLLSPVEPGEDVGPMESITLTLYVGEIREVLKVARGGGCG